MSNLIERSRYLLQNVRFFTLATSSASGTAWAATLNHVTRHEPLRLIWYSMARAIHSAHIREHGDVGGSIFFDNRPEHSFLGLDGAQFTGVAREISRQDECRDIYHYYYLHNFPDEAIRQQWMLPLSEFFDNGPRRFYELEIAQWWLLDLDGWAQDKQDQRISVPLNSITANTPEPL